MHLAINASELGRHRGGNETFIAGLVSGLDALAPANRISLLTCRWDSPVAVPAAFHQVDLGVYRQLPFFVWQQTRALKRIRADWYLSNFFFPLFLPCRGIVAVHDLSFRAHPEYFPWFVAQYMRWLTGRAVQQAKWVITISEFSRQELLRFYPVASEKVRVIPLGVEKRFAPPSGPHNDRTDQAFLAQYGVEAPYILALGNIHPRKNLARLLDAYLLLRQQRQDLPAMVWSGLQYWDSHELVQRAREAGVVLTGFVAKEHLPALYRQASLLVYPSLYEGFGLPTLEAMACGTPVVASNTTSLPEVVGQAALTVNPTDARAIAASIARLLDEPGLRQSLVGAGLKWAAGFTWKRTARQVLDLLEAGEQT